MRVTHLIVLTGWLTAGSLLGAAAPPVSLMPAVSEARWGESIAVPGRGIVVLSEQAGPAEREAARLLCRHVEKRFGSQWPIFTAKEAPPDARLRVFLGQRQTFPALDRLCREQELTVPEHQDGYALKIWARGGTITAVVAGMNDLGVIYGQDTLFQLFTGKPGTLVVQTATIRDWPTIPLRGRPHPHYQYFFKPENFDCVMTSRFNFIDIRDGIYAFEPGAKLKRDEIAPIITKARNLGLRVYAAVNCGIPLDQQDAAINTFKEFIEMGADGLWASFDDRGAGADPVRMVTRIIALGRQHGITGDAIATTPPKGDYQTIRTEFNRKVVAVPGMEQAVWYWTSVPCAQDSADGADIGLRVQPSWWHNWPRFHPPALHSGAGQGYMPVISLGAGWNHPNDRELTEMGRYVHAIMPWDGWQARQHYLIPVLGWWSWRPEKHDFQAVRRRIYDMVFGPGQVENAMAFDDTIDRIRGRFQFWATHTDFAPMCPPRLKSLDDRARIQAEFQELEGKLASLRKEALSASLLDRGLLRQDYLDPMAREIKTGFAQTQAPYPEYWYHEHQSQVLRAVYDGDTAKVEQLNAGVRERILEQVSQVEKLLDNPSMTSRYVEWWRTRADATPADWQQLIEKRKESLQKNIDDYSRNVAPFGKMTEELNDPPIQVGTGPWERHNHLLATVLPEPHETFWGDWYGGIYERDGIKVATFAIERRQRVNAGTHCEMPVNIPITGRRDRLALIIYVTNITKESFGLGRAKWRWSGYRSIKLLWGDRELWKADLGIPRLTGEWFVVPLPVLPSDLETLALRLRIEDYYSAKNNLEIVYVGPIHLLELDGS